MMADLVVTPDTGTAWAVAMEQMPKIVMVSHASAENITKHWVNTTTLHADPQRVPCWPCHRLHNDISTCVPDKDVGKGAACMGDISVETVVQAVDKAWSKPAGNVVPLRAAE
jgi:ADP-heptose:LPS heptosyltransferase